MLQHSSTAAAKLARSVSARSLSVSARDAAPGPSRSRSQGTTAKDADFRYPTQLDAPTLKKQLHARSSLNKQLKRKADDKLRAAIGLYHLAPAFYPSSSSSSEASASSPDAALSDRIVKDILYAPAPPIFHTVNAIDSAAEKARTSKLEDGAGGAPFRPRIVRDGEISEAALSGRPSAPRSAPTAPPPPPQTYLASDAASLAMEARSQFVDTRSGVRVRHLPGSQQVAHEAHLDARGAQLRDALYGTVASALPGLEVVRDRWKARVRRREEEKRSEAGGGDSA